MRFIPLYNQPNKIFLKDVFKKKGAMKKFFNAKPVALVFVHGSLAKNKLRHLSDIDIAVLFKKENYALKDIHVIKEKIGGLLGREDIDLAILNKASPLLCMQVLKNGKLLYASNTRELIKFRLKTIKHYLATKHLRQSLSQYMNQAILG